MERCYSLTQKDLEAIVQAWARSQGIANARVTFYYYPGDRPGESASFAANVRETPPASVAPAEADKAFEIATVAAPTREG